MITNLKCNLVTKPIGVDAVTPTFSWNIENEKGNIFQKNYQIVVYYRNKVFWDSGTVEDKNTNGINYNGTELKSLKRYDVDVKITLSDNRILEEQTYFVTGLIQSHDKNAKWIVHPDYNDNPIFYKDINIKGDIKQAYIAISGLGYYEMTINNVKAHDSVLVPAWTDYMDRDLSQLNYPYENNSDKLVLYNTYDIKEYFKKGNNSFKVMLGNGMFSQSERNAEGDLSYGCPRLFAKIVIEYTNGEKQEVITDDSFYVTEGPFELNNIYYGEIYNDNIGRDFSYSQQAEVIDEVMGELQSQYSGYDQVIDSEIPEKITDSIYKVSKNMTGWVRVKAKATRGAKFTLKFFEQLNEDMTPNYYSCGGEWQVQSDTYIFFDDEEITYEPTFTWHGFTYFEIEKDVDVEIIELTAVEVHANIKQTGSVKTDHETVNWLYNTYINTQLSNYHGLVPSDCPHRERLGYTGDGHITIDSSLYSLDSYYLYKKWNTDIIKSQNKESGFIPHTAPFAGGGGGPAWGMAVAIVPYIIYQHTFDKGVLEDSYDAIVGWIEYLKGKSKDYIIDKEEDGSWCLGEWCIPVEGYQVENIDIKSLFEKLDPKLVNTCYFYHVVEIAETISIILDHDSGEYLALKKEIAAAINEKYLNTDTFTYYKGEYGANIYPLYFNIVPEEYKERVLKALEEDIAKNEYKMITGIFATSMLPKVLLENKKEYLFKKIIDNNEYPSFGYMKNKKATTLWETWDQTTSINHPMFGGIVSYLYKYIAGIKYINKNNEIVIEPNYKTGINKADISYQSIYGLISVKWEIQDKNLSINIEVPNNVKVVFIHEGTFHVLDDSNSHFDLIVGNDEKNK